MKRIAPVVLLLTIIFAGGCRKQSLPESIEGTPVFSFEGMIGKDSLSIAAGKNDYYLYTTSEFDSLNIFSFSGEFGKTACSKCPGTLSFSIRDYRTRTAKNIPDIQNALHPGPYKFYSHHDSTFAYRFIADTLFFGPNNFKWDLGDGSITDAFAFTYIYPAASPAPYKVCMNTVSPSGCPSDICNLINGDPKGGCNAFFKTMTSSGTMGVQFSAPMISGNTYKWDFGDSTSSANLNSPNHTYQKPGVFKVCLTVTSNNGACSSSFCKMVAVGNPVNKCGSSYSCIITRVPANLSSVLVKWMDLGGNSYSSAPPKGKMQNTSVFEILSVEDYQINSTGQQTKKITAKLNAVLYNESNFQDSLLINSAKFVFAVAYP